MIDGVTSPQEKMITISLKSYNNLISDSIKLGCLEAHGVENWEWYDDAMEDYENG